MAAVERDEESGERRWFVRVRGEAKDVFTIWFHLRQRTLHYETYMMPAPEENHGALYEHLLRRNRRLYGASFAIGDEDAIFLIGQIDNGAVDDDERTGSSGRSTSGSSSSSTGAAHRVRFALLTVVDTISWEQCMMSIHGGSRCHRRSGKATGAPGRQGADSVTPDEAASSTWSGATRR